MARNWAQGTTAIGTLCLLAAACGGDAETTTTSGTSSGSGGAASVSSSATGGSSASAGGSLTVAPDPQFVPAATGACPDFATGDATFSPTGIAPRQVKLWANTNAADQDGPLVFYWHGTGSNPGEANFGLGAETINAILAQGGVVAAPYSDPGSGNFPWFLTAGGGREDDLQVADEILACAIEKAGIDLRRIHTIGMSAGGLQASQMAYRRSGYVASVAPYSGGKLGNPPQQEAQNKFAAMIFHGGAGDQVIVNFKDLSEGMKNDLQSKGHFAFICDHGMGHKIPSDARASVWQFFQDHPFGTAPPPYAAGLPQGFPSYCGL